VTALLRASGLPSLRPTVFDPESEARLAKIADRCLESGDGGPVAEVPVRLVEFLQWLAERRDVLFHGSRRADLEVLEPIRQSRDTTPFGDQQGVFASSDPAWAMYFAVLVRGGAFRGTRNGSIGLAGSPLYPRRYFFSVNQGALAEQRFGAGSIYVVPREPFSAEPATMGLIDTGQWAAPTAVRPLFRLDVRPDDFPFVDLVVQHRPREPMLVTMLRAVVRARLDHRFSSR
jgi:hypothetical protein